MGARAYSAETGRFSQTDPLPSQMFEQPYGYTGGNPVNFTDPAGLYTTRCKDAVVTLKYKHPF